MGEGGISLGVGGVHSTGVGVLFKGRDFFVGECFSSVQGRVLFIDFDYRGTKFRIINVYAPAESVGRRELFGGLDTVLCCSRVLILGGDFNVSFEKGDSSLVHLNNVIKKFDLKDGFRAAYPTGEGYTWGNSRGSRSRIDFVFVPKESGVIFVDLLPVWFTDHVALSVKFNVFVVDYGPGYWKVNISVLADENFKISFREMYAGWAEMRPYSASAAVWWEGVKVKIKIFVRRYSSWKRKQELSDFRDLRRRLQELYGVWNRGESWMSRRWSSAC